MKIVEHDGNKVKIWSEDEFFELVRKGKIRTKLTREITPYRNPLGTSYNLYDDYSQETNG